MKITYLIVIIILILVLLAVRYQYSERKKVPMGKVNVCLPSNKNDCQHVDETIVNIVYEKALSLANADNTEMFPIESLDDMSHTFSAAALDAIAREVATSLGLDIEGKLKHQFTSTQEVVLWLHEQSQRTANH